MYSNQNFILVATFPFSIVAANFPKLPGLQNWRRGMQQSPYHHQNWFLSLLHQDAPRCSVFNVTISREFFSRSVEAIMPSMIWLATSCNSCQGWGATSEETVDPGRSLLRQHAWKSVCIKRTEGSLTYEAKFRDLTLGGITDAGGSLVFLTQDKNWLILACKVSKEKGAVLITIEAALLFWLKIRETGSEEPVSRCKIKLLWKTLHNKILSQKQLHINWCCRSTWKCSSRKTIPSGC